MGRHLNCTSKKRELKLAKMSGAQILQELTSLLDDEAISQIGGLMEDIGADHSNGELARLGSAFTELGKLITFSVKREVIGSIGPGMPLMEDGVMFEYRGGGTQTRVNSKIIKEQFSPVEYPELYTESHIGESVVIKIGKIA